MSKQVLVLNAGYEPLSLVSVRRAVVLLLREKAELLEATQQMLCAANRTIPVPLVIRLVHYVRLPHRRVPPTRAAIMLRYRDGLSYADIAARLGKTATHVGVLLHEAIQRLRRSPALARLAQEVAS